MQRLCLPCAVQCLDSTQNILVHIRSSVIPIMSLLTVHGNVKSDCRLSACCPPCWCTCSPADALFLLYLSSTSWSRIRSLIIMLKAQHCGCLKDEADHVDVMCFSIGLDSLHIAQFLQIVQRGHENIQVDIKDRTRPHCCCMAVLCVIQTVIQWCMLLFFHGLHGL